MPKEEIRTMMAPEAIGPYSQGIKAGALVFCSGQIPMDPATGEIVSGGIGEQTKQVMDNLMVVLMTGGCSFDDVVKATVYLTDLNDFDAMNEVYGSFFGDAPPARATVQVSALPKGARVEIDLIALGQAPVNIDESGG